MFLFNEAEKKPKKGKCGNRRWQRRKRATMMTSMTTATMKMLSMSTHSSVVFILFLLILVVSRLASFSCLLCFLFYMSHILLFYWITELKKIASNFYENFYNDEQQFEFDDNLFSKNMMKLSIQQSILDKRDFGTKQTWILCDVKQRHAFKINITMFDFTAGNSIKREKSHAHAHVTCK